MTVFIFIVLVLFVIVFFTRALPFLFSNYVRNSPILKILSPSLPLAIMTLLLAHGIFSNAKFLPGILSVIITAIVHLNFKQTFISIFTGTLCYSLLIRFF